MKIIDLLEMPVRNWSKIGQFDKPRSMHRPEDVALANSPKYEPKVRRLFQKVHLPIDMIFINDNDDNDYLRATGMVINNRTFTKLTGLPQPAPDAITMLYVSSQEKRAGGLPNTPWILAHKIGECVVNDYDFYDRADRAWEHFISLRTKYLGHIYGTSPTGKHKGSYLSLQRYFQMILTMKSARDQKLFSMDEALAECVAQYLVTGTITFNEMDIPDFDDEVEIVRQVLLVAIKQILPTMVGKAYLQ